MPTARRAPASPARAAAITASDSRSGPGGAPASVATAESSAGRPIPESTRSAET